LQLRYTKPGVTGQQYKQIQTAIETNPSDTEYEEPAFGHISLALQKITSTQRKEQEKTYKSQLKKRIEKEKIANDEMNELVGTLILVVEDLEAILRGENEDFLACVKRWMEKAPNVMKKNIAPFTPTGDINDALFSVCPRTTPFDWVIQDDKQSENSPVVKDYFSISLSNLGSWFTDKEAHDCWQQIVKADGRTNLVYTNIDENEIVWDINPLSEAEHEDVTGEQSKISDQVKDPEKLQKLEELDDPDKLWKVKKRMRHQIMKRVQKFIEERRYSWKLREDNPSEQQLIDRLIEEERQVAEKFLKQKLQNVVEFEKLCNS
jgi:hypothetical protein